jgi:hypothetical protein
MKETTMATFERYGHVERLGTAATDGILFGDCYIFPKLDGTNAQVWVDDEGKIQAGSRNRQLGEGSDNAGFREHAIACPALAAYFRMHPGTRLYGEWLVPHTIKGYRDDTWRKFYVFDVVRADGTLMHFEKYAPLLDAFGVEYIPPIRRVINPTTEEIHRALEQNTYCMKDGEGAGEGIVIKQYGWVNKWGNEAHAKLVRAEFKDKALKTFPNAVNDGKRQVEVDIAEKFVTAALVGKERAKIELQILNDNPHDPDAGGILLPHREKVLQENRKQIIPRLLEQVYHAVVTEEIWNMLRMKGVKVIDFAKLRGAIIAKTKTYAGDLF